MTSPTIAYPRAFRNIAAKHALLKHLDAASGSSRCPATCISNMQRAIDRLEITTHIPNREKEFYRMISRFFSIAREDGLSEAIAGAKRYYEDNVFLGHRLRIQFLRWRHEPIIQKEIHGSQMKLDTRQKGVHTDLALYGTREKHSMEYYKQRLAELGEEYEDVVVLDIGANIGHLALLAASQIPHARVYAFEPDPRNNKWLTENIRLNNYNNIETSELAFGSTPGTATLQIHQESNLSKISDVTTDDDNIEKTVEVKVTTIDDIMRDIETTSETLVVLRMDTEEYEFEIFKGANELLESDLPLYTFTELHYRHVSLEELEWLVNRLDDCGLSVEQIRDGLGRHEEPIGSNWNDFREVKDDGLSYPWRFDKVSVGLTHLFAHRSNS